MQTLLEGKKITPWELLQKKTTWEQLNFIHNQRILDFGSGGGMTADHFARDNEVIAVEPNENMLGDRFRDHHYIQIQGDVQALKRFEAETFDVILCHNVLEYAAERQEILQEFARILKKDGLLSVVKHNKTGRIMQMVVLLNNFGHASELLSGGNGQSQQFGAINYYEENDLLQWSDQFVIERTLGIRTFWDLQQNQEIQKDPVWQERMLEIELRVSEIPDFKAIAFLHHIILRKK